MGFAFCNSIKIQIVSTFKIKERICLESLSYTSVLYMEQNGKTLKLESFLKRLLRKRKKESCRIGERSEQELSSLVSTEIQMRGRSV